MALCPNIFVENIYKYELIRYIGYRPYHGNQMAFGNTEPTLPVFEPPDYARLGEKP
jgi:hypothetical protein